MRRYLPPKCGFEVDGPRIVSDGTVANKVTGTTVAQILGLSPFGSPFQAACSLLGLGREDISSKPAVRTGQFLERRIIEYAGLRYPQYGAFVPAADVYGERRGDHDTWPSDFDDETFAGHVDGLVMDADGGTYILEVKTSANLDSWTDGVPEYYYWQVALYNEFMCGMDVAYVILGMVDETVYRTPSAWVPGDDNVVLFRLEIDREEVRAGLDRVREWYAKYILNARTPEYDPTNPGDVELYSHLVSLAETEEDKATTLDRLAEVDCMIAEAEEGIRSLYEARDALREDIKSYMGAHGMSEMASRSGTYAASLYDQVRTYIDPVKLEADGIDPQRYTTRKVNKALRIRTVMDLRRNRLTHRRNERCSRPRSGSTAE